MWLAYMQVKIESDIRAPMGRVLDVAQIGGMQVGAVVCMLIPARRAAWRKSSGT